MDKIENLIKGYLEKNLDLGQAEKTAQCPSEEVLSDYLKQKLNKESCQIIERHIADCGFCLSQLNLAFQAQIVNKQGGFAPVPPGLIEKTKAALGIDKEVENREMTKKKRIKKNLFGVVAIISFVLSFLIPKYFIQFLVATLILGLRWVLESEGGRTLIMVLDSWRKQRHDDDDEISPRLKKRFSSFRK